MTRARRLHACRLAAAAIIALYTLPLPAQGCAQCKDAVDGAPPETQRAYRHAIEILAGSGVAVFATGLVLLRRYR